VPEGALRDLAVKVPEDVRETLSPLELRLRVTEAFNIISNAEGIRDEGRRDREMARGSRILKAASPSTYGLTMAALQDEVRAARLEGNERKAYEVEEAMRRYGRRNPQPSADTLLAAGGAMLTRLRVPPPEPNRRSALTRRFSGRSRRGKR
jgi:hypothetical protein